MLVIVQFSPSASIKISINYLVNKITCESFLFIFSLNEENKSETSRRLTHDWLISAVYWLGGHAVDNVSVFILSSKRLHRETSKSKSKSAIKNFVWKMMDEPITKSIIALVCLGVVAYLVPKSPDRKWVVQHFLFQFNMTKTCSRIIRLCIVMTAFCGWLL